MTYCVQCGETLALDAAKCPTCGRPVGLSSIGPALERQPSRAALRAVRVLAVVAALVVVAGGVLWFVRGSDRVTAAEKEHAGRAAAASAVVVTGRNGDAPGLVVRRFGDWALVATRASAAPAGRAVTVAAGGAKREGLSVLVGRGRALADLALVLVTGGSEFPAAEIRTAGKPALEMPVLAIANGETRGTGRVLSFEDGPGAGTLVHDAQAAGTYGLFSRTGKLVALPTFAASGEDSMAVSASALLERLMAQEIVVNAGIEWAELGLPITKGAQVALAAAASAGAGLQARIGQNGAPARARPAAAGLVLLQPATEQAGQLQIGVATPTGDAAGIRTALVALAPL